MVGQRQGGSAAARHRTDMAAQQYVVELPVGVFDGQGGMVGQCPVSGDGSGPRTGHVEVTHQDDRVGERGQVAPDPGELPANPARDERQVGVNHHHRPCRRRQLTDDDGSGFLVNHDHLARFGQPQGEPTGYPWQAEDLPIRHGIAG